MHKILVVDDDQDLLLLLKRNLTNKGFEVQVLAEGKNVLNKLEIFQPDLIILDINLGDSDGREICRAIKTQLKYAQIPIILYSAETWPDLQIEECKANAFIQKPFSNTFFMEKVEALMAS